MKRTVKKIEDHEFIVEMNLPEKGKPSVFDADLVCIVSPPYNEGDASRFVPVLEGMLGQAMLEIDTGYKLKTRKSQVVEPGEILLKTQFELGA